jgi:phage-related minor tail protein
MSTYDDDLNRLETQFAGLEGTLTGLEAATAAFRRELDGAGSGFRDAGREAAGMSRSVTGSLRRAFDGILFDGQRLGDALRGIGQTISSTAVNQALAPVQGAMGGVIGSGLQALLGGVQPFAAGGVVSAGRVQAFARGGVVDGPVRFPMRGGMGLMGETGAEAIMPLARGADGRLGVQAAGPQRQAVNVTVNVTTPDVEGFRRSRSQIAAELGRAVQLGNRNL